MKKIHQKFGAVLAAALSLTLVLAAMPALASQGMPGSGSSGSAPGTPPDGGSGGGGGGASTMTYDYTGTVTGTLEANGTDLTSDGATVSSTSADVNTALAANGGSLTITNGTLTKSGDDTNGDNCNFYGINSIILSVNDGSAVYVAGTNLTADSEGSNGIFATDGALVYAMGDTITTTAGNSRGLDATYGGTIIASSMNITTSGDHCAALATDRGGGYISVTDSTLSTAGSGSPLLYSTGDIEVDNVTGTASGSQIAGMEGLNTILIYNSDLTSTNTEKTASDPVADGVIIYQSTSGDAEATTGETALFQAVDSKLTSAITSGSMFYVTNTTAKIYLKNTALNFDSSAAMLLYIAGNDANNWGSAGSNGGSVTATFDTETASGDIVVDTISSLDLYLLNGTSYSGAISLEENANGSSSDSGITVNVDDSSSWIVTGNSTITNLNVSDGGKVVDANGSPVTIVANGQTVVEGTSSWTVTVTGSYATSVSTSEDNAEYTSYIDRTAYDKYYNVTTTFGTSSNNNSSENSEQSSETSSQESSQESSESSSEVSQESSQTSTEESSEASSQTSSASDSSGSMNYTAGSYVARVILVIALAAVIVVIFLILRSSHRTKG